MVVGLAVLRGIKQKARIRRDVEWRFRQPLKFVIHKR
jgi:hypothetical protein